ncbi:MAG: tellurite resistance/C4-dicarboxylate transporter family protein [Pseudolabrys sp.]
MTKKQKAMARPSVLPAGASGWLLRQVDTLYPGSFALVMATGIVSNALYFETPRLLSDVLFAINLVAYPLLLAATVARALRVPRAVWADILNPRLAFGFFSMVAATDVLGVGIHLRGYGSVALALWLFALVLWLVLIYLSFAVLTFLNQAHRANVVDGGWLLAIVGTESLVVLGTLVAQPLSAAGPIVFVAIHMLWGIGLALYGIFITLFAYRVFFFEVEPDDVTPLLWVVMGAAAISTNAGSVLIVSNSAVPFLHSMRAFIDGATLVIWAWATWWIPLLVLLGVWKHGIRRVPIRYTPMLWSLVFPLGMYAVASLRLSDAAGVPLLTTLSEAMVWIALAAWAATAAGFALTSWRSYRAFARA